MNSYTLDDIQEVSNRLAADTAYVWLTELWSVYVEPTGHRVPCPICGRTHDMLAIDAMLHLRLLILGKDQAVPR
jgi:hypothetical protein